MMTLKAAYIGEFVTIINLSKFKFSANDFFFLLLL